MLEPPSPMPLARMLDDWHAISCPESHSISTGGLVELVFLVVFTLTPGCPLGILHWKERKTACMEPKNLGNDTGRA